MILSKKRLYNQVPLCILSLLTKNPNTPRYQREISRKAKVSIGATNQVLKEFREAGLVTRERRGRMYFYLPDMDNPLIRHFKIFENILELEDLIRKLRGRCSKIILFGSCATGKNTLESDIDLFLQTEDPQKVRKLLNLQKALAERIKPVIVNNLEFISLKKKDKTFYEQIREGIILWEKKG